MVYKCVERQAGRSLQIKLDTLLCCHIHTLLKDRYPRSVACSPKANSDLGVQEDLRKGFEMFCPHMTLMSLYSAKVPRIRTKKLSRLTVTGIENRDDMRSMLVDLSRVNMEKCASLEGRHHNWWELFLSITQRRNIITLFSHTTITDGCTL